MAPAAGPWPWLTLASSWSRARGSGVRRPGGAGGWNQQRGDGDRRSSGPTLQLQHTEGPGAPAEVDKQCDDRLHPDKQQFGLAPCPGAPLRPQARQAAFIRRLLSSRKLLSSDTK